MKREWLIELRIKKKFTQEQLAIICGTTQMNISSIENGTRRPSTELAQKLAKVLKFKWTKFYEENNNQSQEKELEKESG